MGLRMTRTDGAKGRVAGRVRGRAAAKNGAREASAAVAEPSRVGLYSTASAAVNGAKKKKVVKLGELFCGAGGMALGAHGVDHEGYRYQHIWATDYNQDACNTFEHNLEGTDVICRDIKDVDFQGLPRVDGLLFGFPCNDFSSVGEKKGAKGQFGGLYRHCVRALQTLKPKFFVAENVGGLRSSNDSKDYDRILSELAGCGYTVTWHYYKFEKYGIPQRRHRLFIVGFRKDLGIAFQHVNPTNGKKSARDALERPPISSNAFNHEQTRQSQQVVERLRHIKQGQNAFNAELPAHLQLNVGGAKMSMIYRRLEADQPSYTITGSGGGGTHVYHYTEDRALTNRERARLQTFPDDFVFKGSKESVRRQIGMAVPPEGARIILEQVLRTLHAHR